MSDLVVGRVALAPYPVRRAETRVESVSISIPKQQEKLQRMSDIKHAFFAARNRLKTKQLDVPEFGPVTIRELNAAKASELGKTITGDEDVNAMVLWVIASVVDGDNQPVFTDDDHEELGKLPAAIIIYIGKAAIELNGFTAPEDKVKNSEASQT